MSRREEIEKKTEALLKPIAETNEVTIYDVEFVKEAGEWYLRAYIDRDRKSTRLNSSHSH